jgi:hypothetical protein
MFAITFFNITKKNLSLCSKKIEGFYNLIMVECIKIEPNIGDIMASIIFVGGLSPNTNP